MNKKKLLMIGGPVLLLLIALIAAKMTVLAPPPVDEDALAKKPGAIYTVSDPFVVNLADDGGTSHFAKVGVALRLSELTSAELGLGGGGHGAPAAEPTPIPEDPEIRDIVISTLQSKSSEELGTEKGRDEVKEEIVEHVNEHTHLKILDVYYTEFAVQ